MKTLIGMTDFVLEQNLESESPEQFYNDCFFYATFLKQPLELWMFVPCKLVDGVWVVLEEPILKPICCNKPNDDGRGCPECCGSPDPDYDTFEWSEYFESKERCLFESYDGTIEKLKDLISLNITVESMTKYSLKLTKNALKQIGL